MPHFRLETNVPQDKIPSDLPQKICQAIASSLGKPLQYCVATVIGNVNMSFGGTNEACAQATLMSIGCLDVDKNKKHSKVFYDLICDSLAISPQRLGIVIVCFVLTIVIILRCLTKKAPRVNRYDRLSTDEC